MNFEDYAGKYIKITCTDGQIVEGHCCGYELMINDDELEEDEIDIEKSTYIISVKESEIQNIEVIEK